MKHNRLHNGIYGVLGSDIGYSLSPMIFRRVFDRLGWRAVYAQFDLPARRLKPFVRAAADAGIVGFNVTKPYKQSIVACCDHLDESAALVGAVNTVTVERGRITGFNTDVDGIIASLMPHRRILRNQEAVIIGAGGAARAVAWVLADRFEMRQLTVVARRPARARQLLHDIGFGATTDFAGAVITWGRAELRDAVENAALMVNATPLGSVLTRRASPLPAGVALPSRAVVFDLVYTPHPTPLQRRARQARCRAVIDGWPMLIAQADASFALWTGRRFPADVRRDLLARRGIRP
ncbi:MAG TPA: shikimate dehydrogenase [Acidobacteriota bacterium]|nr:shikimate dehydrogenase [Acidobacteriota bacterium]